MDDKSFPNGLTRVDVLRMQQLLATDTASLSITEFSARTGDDEDKIREQLLDLRERGLVKNEDIKWGVTERGIESLKEINQYDQIGILRDMYSAAQSSE